MIPQNAPLSALPRYWQTEITKLRRENARNRIRLREARAQVAEMEAR